LTPLSTPEDARRWLSTPDAVRARSADIFAHVARDRSPHFRLDLSRLDAAARYVGETIRADYPDLAIPPHSRWRHFTAGGIDRWGDLIRGTGSSGAERARMAIDLAVTSVLLDAGAGDRWRYREAKSDAVFARSEGLAVASFDLFAGGAFSATADRPHRADAAALKRFDAGALRGAFQVGADNPLTGLDGRAHLLCRLGEAVEAAPDVFGGDTPRIGNLYDFLSRTSADGGLEAVRVLSTVLDALWSIWPGRISLSGRGLGDVWRHSAIHAGDPSDGLVPFHKLSQWLVYSLVEPLEAAGLTVTGLDRLTGLPEYRNGGLFVDLGVVVPKDRSVLAETHAPGAEVIVEWRALTVALLDRIVAPVGAELGVALTMAQVLESGTWSAGRRIAAELRPGGPPPIRVESDGTVM
jgi:hypothetical protein